jgi:16S rRNA (uracil1498-N3)-methyltransferase
MHRFFVSVGCFQQGDLVLSGDQAHQIHDVLRLVRGEVIAALDNSGAEFRVELTRVSRGEVRGRVLERLNPASEPLTRLTLYQSILKADKFEWVLQKGTEIGVAEFVPMITSRVVASSISGAKHRRWERIVVEASEQAGRGKIPAIRPVQRFEDALGEAGERGGLAVIPWEGERSASLRSLLESSNRDSAISVFIGPEGGLATAEIAAARARNVHAVGLGPRILRAETAGLVTASAILFARGELEPNMRQYDRR